jgi:glutamyl-tRNA synthetase
VDDKVIVRFAPSPTGFLHLGSARTALFNWLAARSRGGRFLLRIEDTDKVRSEQRFLDEILEDLRWLGLDWDGEPIRQSGRFDLYRAKAEELRARGLAYRDGEAYLFKVAPGRTIAFDDMIHGRIAVETETLKDQVLIKSDGSPAYNFCCVIDDASQGITHILRGDDHISNTPKQILFYEAFGLQPPRFGHMPLILGSDGSKLSKRHGGVSVAEYKAEGFLPDALANYLILLGWTPPGGREMLSLAEACGIFRTEDMSGVQAKFDAAKLKWMNGEYILRLPAGAYVERISAQLRADGLDPDRLPPDRLAEAAEQYRVRIKTLREFGQLADFFFRDDYAVEAEGRAKHLEPAAGRAALALFAERLAGLDDWRRDSIEALCRSLAEEKGLKPAALIHPARMAVSGKTRGAGLFEIMEILGRPTVLSRMKEAAS